MSQVFFFPKIILKRGPSLCFKLRTESVSVLSSSVHVLQHALTDTAVHKKIIYLWPSLQKIQTTTFTNQNNFNWAFTPAKIALCQSIQSSYWIWRAFWAHVQQFSRLLDKFEVWVSCEAVWDIFNQFFCLIFLKWNSIF